MKWNKWKKIVEKEMEVNEVKEYEEKEVEENCRNGSKWCERLRRKKWKRKK